MIESMAEALEVSTGVMWALLALAMVQVLVAVAALVDLARRPRVRFDMKWLWALIIIVFSNSFIGPILYLAIGRNVPEEIDVAAGPDNGASTGDRTRRAVDALYGEDGRS